MVTHYVTLKALQLEFHRLLAGRTVAETYSQEKNELVLTFAEPAGEPGASVVISIDPQLNFIVLRDHAARARRNSVDLFAPVTGASLREVSMDPSDRTMSWHFDGDLTLCVQLYNTIRSNVLLVDVSRRILGAFKGGKELEGETLASSVRGTRAASATPDELAHLLRSEPERTFVQALKRELPQLGTLFAREILFRAGAAGGELLGDCSDELVLAVAHKYRDLIASLSHPEPALYLRGTEPVAFSPVRLRSLESDETVAYPDTNAGVRDVLKRNYRSEGSSGVKKELLGKLRADLERAEKRRDAVATQIRESKRAEEYERAGKLLLSSLHEVTKGMREIVLKDFDGVADIPIALDATLSPSANAERYFTKAKKAKVARAEAVERFPELEQRAAALKALADDLEQRQTMAESTAFMEEHEDELRSMKLIAPAKGKELPPFRVFPLDGGFEVWVGKSSANNDLLTMKYAKPHDLWFHVRGASGSHTVLKMHGSEPPPRAVIQQAASIAAYYSKMRNAGSVPVAYCERKHVRKPKGAAAGAVVMEREKTILVKPGLP